MGLYTDKHLKTFHIVDGVKKINYATIKRMIVENDNILYTNFAKGPVNHLLWTKYRHQADEDWVYHMNYINNLKSLVKHSYLSYVGNVTRGTPNGIDIPSSAITGPTHMNIYNEYVDLSAIATIRYEEN